MLLTVTDNSLLYSELWDVFQLGGVFSYFVTPHEALFAENIPNDVTAILIDYTSNRTAAKEICLKLKSRFPNAKIAALASKNGLAYERFTYAPGADIELILPVTRDRLAAFVYDHYYKQVQPTLFSDPRLYISHNRNDSRLLGYMLELTSSEHRILLLLASFPNCIFSTDEICKLCFGGAKASSIKVHVCNINKKAKALSGRKLINSYRPQSYSLNRNM